MNRGLLVPSFSCDITLLPHSTLEGCDGKMKFFSGWYTLKFSFDEVTSSLWRRYPNPYSKHVLSEDVVSRTVENDKLITKKLITKTNRLPRWGERFVNSKVACIVEETIVDPVAQTFTSYTRNISYQRLMVLEEKCVFKVSPDSKEWTCCQKQAWVSSSVFGFARAIEKFGIERYKKNSSQATKGLEYVLEKLFIPERPVVTVPLSLPQSSLMS